MILLQKHLHIILQNILLITEKLKPNIEILNGTLIDRPKEFLMAINQFINDCLNYMNIQCSCTTLYKIQVAVQMQKCNCLQSL